MFPSALNPYGPIEAKKRLERISNLCILGAFALMGVAVLAARTGAGPVADALAMLMLAAPVAWVVGCGYYAKAKGYSAALGLLGLFGLIALLLVPDRWKAAVKAESLAPANPFGPVAYPR